MCNICAEHLPQWHGGCLEDPRLDVHFDDAKDYLERVVSGGGGPAYDKALRYLIEIGLSTRSSASVSVSPGRVSTEGAPAATAPPKAGVDHALD